MNLQPNQFNEKIKNYILSQTKQVTDTNQRQSLSKYLQIVFQKKEEMKWIEYEYCLQLPFRLLGLNPIPIKGETFESNPLMKNYVDKLSEELKNEMQQKVMKLPCTSPLILIEFQLSDETRTRELMDIMEKLSSRYLPTRKCDEMIELLKEMKLYDGKPIPNDITFSQVIINNNVVTEHDVYTIIKNNSVALFTLFEEITKEMSTTEEKQQDSQIIDPTKREKKNNFIRMDRSIVIEGLAKIYNDKNDEDNSETCSEDPPESINYELKDQKKLKTSQHDYSPYDSKFPSINQSVINNSLQSLNNYNKNLEKSNSSTKKSTKEQQKQIPSVPISFDDFSTQKSLISEDISFPALNIKEQPSVGLKDLALRQLKTTNKDSFDSYIKREMNQLDLPGKRSISQFYESEKVFNQSMNNSLSNLNDIKSNEKNMERLKFTGKTGKIDTNENEVIDCLDMNKNSFDKLFEN